MSDEPRSEREPFRPAAKLDRLRIRSEVLSFVREFFKGSGYWEVETPTLSADIVVDVHLEPFVTQWHENGDSGNAPRSYFLQTSPEFGMKRMLADGAQAIFQIAKAFRNGEVGRLHNPEFTMVEWYRVGDSYHQQMDFTEQLVRAVFEKTASLQLASHVEQDNIRHFDDTSFGCVTYDEAFRRESGTPVLNGTAAELVRLAEEHKVVVPAGIDADDRDAILNLLLAELVSPRLGVGSPEFLIDYPASQAALAQIRNSDPPVAERFELFCDGIELCNGYQELTDADELRRRIADQNRQRAALGRSELPVDNHLLSAMKAGLPICSGVALGFDRLLMLALGAESVSEVMAFPFDRA